MTPGASPDASAGRRAARRPRACSATRMTFDDTDVQPGAPASSHPLGVAVVRRDDAPADDPFFHATGAICSLPVLAAGSRRVRIPQRGARSRRPAETRAAAHRARRPHLPGTCARGGVGGYRLARHVALRVDQRQHLVAECSAAIAASRSTARAICCSGYRGAKRTFPYVSAADVLRGQRQRRRPSRTRSCSSARPRSARARSCRPRSIRCSPASRCRRRVADNLLQQDFIRRPEHGVAHRNAGRARARLIAALLVSTARAGTGERCASGVCLAAVWLGAAGCCRTAASSCRRSFRRSA